MKSWNYPARAGRIFFFPAASRSEACEATVIKRNYFTPHLRFFPVGTNKPAGAKLMAAPFLGPRLDGDRFGPATMEGAFRSGYLASEALWKLGEENRNLLSLRLAGARVL